MRFYFTENGGSQEMREQDTCAIVAVITPHRKGLRFADIEFEQIMQCIKRALEGFDATERAGKGDGKP